MSLSKVNEIMYQYGVSDLDKVALVSRADEGLSSNSFSIWQRFPE